MMGLFRVVVLGGQVSDWRDNLVESLECHKGQSQAHYSLLYYLYINDI